MNTSSMKFLRKCFFTVFATCLLFSTEIHAQVPEQGLIFYVPFDTGLDALISGGNPKAMIQGDVTLFEKGLKGKGVLVNGGAKNELKYESAGNLNGKEGTISMFVYSDGFALDDEFFHVFFDSYDSPMKTSDAIILYKHFKIYNSVQFFIRPKGEESKPYICKKSDFRWNPREWHHLAATWGNNTMALYIDGDKVAECSYSGDLEKFGKYFFIGASHNRWAYRPPQPDTVIDELRIYNRRLDETEIKKIYSEFNLKEINKTNDTKKSSPLTYKPPFAEVNFSPVSPEIDGIINPEEWKYATVFSGMVALNLGFLTTHQVRFYLTYDEKNLYIAMENPILKGEKLSGTAIGKRDVGSICNHDSIEIYLDPLCKKNPAEVFQFLGNFYGDIFDRKGVDTGWNGEWTFKNKVTETMWSAEISISFSSLGVKTPQEGEVWGINLCRNFTTGTEKWSSLSRGTYGEPDKFASIKFRKKGLIVQSPNLYELETMTGKYDWVLFNSSPSGKALRLFSRVYSNEGKLLEEREWEQILISSGESLLHTITLEAGKFLKSGGIYFYEFTVQDGRVGPIVFNHRIPVRFKTPENKAQEVLSPQEKKKQQDAFAKPWRGNTIGIDHTVPPPWTPVKFTNKAVEIWGRKYIMDKGILPSKIETAGEQILAEPIRMVIITNGREIDIGRIPWKKTHQYPDIVTLLGEGNYSNLVISSEAQIEFDGMMRFDITFNPRKSSLNIEKLYLEIPVYSKNAIYTHYFRDRWDTAYSGYLPKEGILLDFRRQVWLGDEKRGIAWFTPSMKNWDNIEKNIIKISPADNKVTLRINIIDHTVTRTKPFTITFGLQATPVKPRPDDWRKWQQFRPETGEIPKSRKYFLANHMWRYGEGFSSPIPGDPEYFRKEVERLHSEGYLAIPYAAPTFMSKLKHDITAMRENRYTASKYLDEFTREYTLFADDWKIIPVKDWGNTIAVCPNSEWTDYLVWAINDMVEKYGIDGIYFDCVWVDPCQNEKHGCGYLDSHGNYQPQFNIFEQRELKKRIYKIFKKLNKDTLIIDHLSAILDAPLISFCDIGFNGEQVQAGPSDNYFNLLRLDQIRTEFTGIQWGFIPMIMSMFKTDHKEVQKNPEAAEKFFNLVFLHDILYYPLWINWDAYRRFASTYIEFGIFDAKFLPYWESPAAAITDADDVKISAYVLPKKALLIVSNTGPEEKRVRVTINKKVIGMKKFQKNVKDLFHREDFSMNEDGVLFLPLKPYNFRAIQIIEE